MKNVTIVIPIRNRAAFLPQLFATLADVTYEELEILLVDNGSTDSSLGRCRSFAEDAPMVVTVIEEPTPGANAARNRGLAACRTDWVYFFDSDDELTSTFLEEIMPLVTDEDMIAFPTRMEKGGHTFTRAFRPSPSPASQILSSTLNTQGMLFRTAFLRQIGGWDTRLDVWQDWELGIRALLHRPRILWLRQPFHLIHVHPDSITGPSMSARLTERQATLDCVAGEIEAPADCRALFLRQAILFGMLRRERASTAFYSYCVRAGLWYRFLAFLLRHYTALGGRGAWRIALFFC